MATETNGPRWSLVLLALAGESLRPRPLRLPRLRTHPLLSPLLRGLSDAIKLVVLSIWEVPARQNHPLLPRRLEEEIREHLQWILRWTLLRCPMRSQLKSPEKLLFR